MQEDQFKHILKEHAAQFELNVEPGLFDRMMRERSAGAKKRRMLLFRIITLLTIPAVAGAVLFMRPSAPTTTTIAIPQIESRPELITVTRTTSNTGSAANIPQHAGDTNEASLPKSTSSKGNQTLQTAYIGHREPKEEQKSRQVTNPPGTVAKTIYRNKRSKTERNIVVNTANTPTAAAAEATANSVSVISEPVPSVPLPQTTTPASVIISSPVNTNTDTPEPAETSTHEKTNGTHLKADSAQNTLAAPSTKVADKTGKLWSISGMFTAQILNSAYSANSNANLSWFNEYYTNRISNDKARFCYNAGIKLERRISGHFGIGTGLIYSVIEFQELQVIKGQPPAPAYPDSIPTLEATKKTSAGPSIDKNRYDISFTSLEMPLMISYVLDKKKTQWQLSAGVSYNYLLGTRSLVFNETDTMNVMETNDADNGRLQRHRFVFVGAAYVTYKLTPALGIYVGPTYRYSLSSLYHPDYVIRQNPYFIGLEGGIKFSF